MLVPRALPWADSLMPLRGVPSPEQSHLARSADNIEGAYNDEKLLAESKSFFYCPPNKRQRRERPQPGVEPPVVMRHQKEAPLIIPAGTAIKASPLGGDSEKAEGVRQALLPFLRFYAKKKDEILRAHEHFLLSL